MPGRKEAGANIHIGIDWLASVAFGHIDKIGEHVLIIGVGNTAMDCCRTSRRLGGKDVKVMARRPRQFFKASPWELEDAEEEQSRSSINHAPKRFVLENGQAQGHGVRAPRVGRRRQKASRRRTKLDTVILPADDVILAIGQENAFPVDRARHRHRLRQVTACRSSTGRRCSRRGRRLLRRRRGVRARRTSSGPSSTATRRRSRSTTTARASPVTERPPQGMNLISAKMGLHEWSYSNDYNPAKRAKMKHVDLTRALRRSSTSRSSWASPPSRRRARSSAASTATSRRSSPTKLCIECDACIDVCPVHVPDDHPRRRRRRSAPRLSAPAANPKQDALRVGRAAADRARHGEGRGRLRPLRAVRRALPDGRVGHAEVRAHDPLSDREMRRVAAHGAADRDDRSVEVPPELASTTSRSSSPTSTAPARRAPTAC